MKRLLLLPGMDGTGELFGPFVSEVSSWASAQIVRYPTQERLTVEQLLDRIALDAPVTVIAESYSGAIGIRLAARHPKLVLVATFVTPPEGIGLLRLFGTLPFRTSPPRWAVRMCLAGFGASEELVTAVKEALSHVSPEVLAARIEEISRVDERETLRSLQVPVVTIRARSDRLLSSRDTARLRSFVPGAVHADLDGPHLLLQTKAAECAAWLRPPGV